MNATCPFPNPNIYCSTVFGLYVDGIPIPGSARTIVDQRGTIVQRDIASITVLSPSRPAGVHTVTFSGGSPQTGGTSAFTPIYFNTHNDVAPQSSRSPSRTKPQHKGLGRSADLVRRGFGSVWRASHWWNQALHPSFTRSLKPNAR